MGKPKIVTPTDKKPMQVLGCDVSMLCEAEETESKWSLMEVDLPLEAGPPPHHHPWDEAYYVVRGKVRFIIGEEERYVNQGDFIYAPANTVHAFFGADQEGAKVLVFDAPSTAGGFFKDCHKEIKKMLEDLAKIPAIASKYNMHFLPPK